MDNVYNKSLDNTVYYNPNDYEYKFIPLSCDKENMDCNKYPAIKFYQIAMFPKGPSKTHAIRIVYINGQNELVDYKMGCITHKLYKKIIRQMAQNKYRVYPVDTLYYINFPSRADISLARSCILNE